MMVAKIKAGSPFSPPQGKSLKGRREPLPELHQLRALAVLLPHAWLCSLRGSGQAVSPLCASPAKWSNNRVYAPPTWIATGARADVLGVLSTQVGDEQGHVCFKFGLFKVLFFSLNVCCELNCVPKKDMLMFSPRRRRIKPPLEIVSLQMRVQMRLCWAGDIRCP